MESLKLFDLTGKTAIVTGGGRGLGAQMAKGFAEAGANVVVCSRKLEACESVAKELDQLGARTLALQCDVSKPDDVQYVVEETLRQFSHIDILVNNSGATWGAPVTDMPLEAWKKVMDVNVTGTFLMSQAVGKVMIEQKAGKIINIASVAGLGGTDPRYMDTIVYNTSKGAVITFTKDLAVKWGKYNINVNAIAPGFFPTKMSKVIMEQGKTPILEATPLGRFGSDDDLKGAAIFLASDAANFITGDVLIVDGGTHAM
ncbi:SDR family oxidoreductase [Cytobacillus spongiae]|jgi:gluconate 5-dehydrogenase|uniref:SDR family oxidoreductase n=1 Tax=Cytobacillus spongiae TaxID=2901381 RepID=UPI001F2A8918|nr:SDR family oxidoreductase [Cytobacillus spongiae]UII56797.1 SDR family oxidoreductase [Cytobacillus spongiae]